MIKPGLLLLVALCMNIGMAVAEKKRNQAVSALALAGLKAYRDAEQSSYNRRDLEGLMDVFAEDIVVGSVGQPVQRGREALRNFFVRFWREYEVTEIVEVIEDDIQELEGALVVWAHYRVKIAVKAGDPPTYEEGRILCVFKQSEDGKYRLWREAGLDREPAVK